MVTRENVPAGTMARLLDVFKSFDQTKIIVLILHSIMYRSVAVIETNTYLQTKRSLWDIPSNELSNPLLPLSRGYVQILIYEATLSSRDLHRV